MQKESFIGFAPPIHHWVFRYATDPTNSWRSLVLKMSHEQWEDALNKPNVRPMDFTGKSMKGFVYVNQKGFKSNNELKNWVQVSYKHAESVDKNKSK